MAVERLMRAAGPLSRVPSWAVAGWLAAAAIVLLGACGASEEAEEPVLKEVYRAPDDAAVQGVLTVEDGWYVISRGDLVAHGKGGVLRPSLPPLGRRPIPDRGERRRRIIVSPGETAVAILELPDDGTAVLARVQSLKDGQRLWDAEVPARSEFHLSDDGQCLVVVTPQGDGPRAPSRITIVDSGTSNVLPELLEGVLHVSIARDAPLVAIGTLTGKLHVLTKKAETERTLASYGKPLLSADGTVLVAVERDLATIYVDGVERTEIQTGEAPRDAAVTPSGAYVCVVARREVHVWEARSGRSRRLPLRLRDGEELRSVDLTERPFRVLLGSLVIGKLPTGAQPGGALALVRVLSRPDAQPEPLTFPTRRWNGRQPEVRATPAGNAARIVTKDQLQWLEFSK